MGVWARFRRVFTNKKQKCKRVENDKKCKYYGSCDGHKQHCKFAIY